MARSISLGGSDSNLNKRLFDALDAFNAAAIPGPSAQELLRRFEDAARKRDAK